MDTEILERGPSEQISVRLPSRLRVELERIAEQEDRTLSNTIKRILSRALETRNDRELAA
jgi:predicted DNA-binding protein